MLLHAVPFFHSYFTALWTRHSKSDASRVWLTHSGSNACPCIRISRISANQRSGTRIWQKVLNGGHRRNDCGNWSRSEVENKPQTSLSTTHKCWSTFSDLLVSLISRLPPRICDISFVFSNVRRVLSQCNTRLKLLYLSNNLHSNEIEFLAFECIRISPKWNISAALEQWRLELVQSKCIMGCQGGLLKRFVAREIVILGRHLVRS